VLAWCVMKKDGKEKDENEDAARADRLSVRAASSFHTFHASFDIIMKTIMSSLTLIGLVSVSMVGARAQEKPDAPTAAGWVKYDKNPVIGGTLGTCFDVTVLRENDRYRMWFSWRPKRSLALTESEDGLAWSKPAIVLGPNAKSGWEDDINRPVVLK